MLFISNFVLDIYNIKSFVMKRTVLIFVLAALVLLTCAYWFRNSIPNLNFIELMNFVIILMVVGLAIFMGVKRIRSFKRGEPAEDELSKKILVKTSSISYYASIYLWLSIMYFSERLNLANHTLIGLGILGMAVIFVLTWVILNFRGIKDE